MADNNRDQEGPREEDEPSISVPRHAPLPPPPEVQYTRPALGKPAASLPADRSRGAPRSDDVGGVSGLSKLGAGLAAATTFAASVIAGVLIGQWIDHRWNHSGGIPWGTLIFALLGVAAGFINLFRLISATDRNRGKK
jgi:hypothetical protein